MPRSDPAACAAYITSIIKATGGEPAATLGDALWRQARYSAICAHCAQHLGDAFAYVTYTLATFGIATLKELSDHQLEQTYAHFGLAAAARPEMAPICPHACPGVGDGESKRAHISAFPARFARFLMNAAKSVIPQSRQALSSFFALACSVSKRAHPHSCAH